MKYSGRSMSDEAVIEQGKQRPAGDAGGDGDAEMLEQRREQIDEAHRSLHHPIGRPPAGAVENQRHRDLRFVQDEAVELRAQHPRVIIEPFAVIAGDDEQRVLPPRQGGEAGDELADVVRRLA